MARHAGKAWLPERSGDRCSGVLYSPRTGAARCGAPSGGRTQLPRRRPTAHLPGLTPAPTPTPGLRPTASTATSPGLFCRPRRGGALLRGKPRVGTGDPAESEAADREVKPRQLTTPLRSARAVFASSCQRRLSRYPHWTARGDRSKRSSRLKRTVVETPFAEPSAIAPSQDTGNGGNRWDVYAVAGGRASISARYPRARSTLRRVGAFTGSTPATWPVGNRRAYSPRRHVHAN